MNFLQGASNFLTFLDNWMNLTYFEAIDSLETRDDLSLLTSGKVQLSPFTNIDQYNPRGLQPLHYAIQTKNHLAIEWLMAHPNICVDSVTEIESWNSAHCAVKVGDSQVLSQLIRAGVNLNALDNDNLTPLAYAESDLQAENWLQMAPIDFKVPLGPNRRTYFHYFARDSTQVLLDHLIVNDIQDINKTDIHGTTPLMLAAEDGHHEALWKLLSNGAKYDILDGEGRSALHRAAAAGQTKSCRFLLYNTEVLPSNYKLDDEFFTEIDDESIERVKSQAVLFVQDKQGLTPLMAAVLNGHVETVQVLVNENAKHLDLKQEKSGDTALHMAVLVKSAEMVAILLKAGAYADPLNNTGKKPCDLCPVNSEIYDLFIDTL